MNIPRMWIGYAKPGLGREDFREQLGSIFMPATVQIMGVLGMQCYLPAVLPENENLPDEIALVFYPSKEDYARASKESCGGRMYGTLHQTLFDISKSRSAFPKPFTDTLLSQDENYFILFDNQPNWKNENIFTEVWWNNDLSRKEFHECICHLAHSVQPTDNLAGLYLYVKYPLTICWTCWRKDAGGVIAGYPGDVIALPEKKIPFTAGLFTSDNGITVIENHTINFQFGTGSL